MKSSEALAEREKAIVAGAVHFTTFVRRSPTLVVRSEHPDLDAASAEAKVRATEFGQSVMVYAVDAFGSATLVGYWDRAVNWQKVAPVV